LTFSPLIYTLILTKNVETILLEKRGKMMSKMIEKQGKAV